MGKVIFKIDYQHRKWVRFKFNNILSIDNRLMV